MKTKSTIIIISISLLAVIGVLSLILLRGNSTNENKKDFLKNMGEIQYIKIQYSGYSKELGNELAQILNDIDESSIDNSSSKLGNGATGEQAFKFDFYDKNGNQLYGVQFKKSSKSIYIYAVETQNKLHSIDDSRTLNYIVQEVQKFEKEFLNY